MSSALLEQALSDHQAGRLDAAKAAYEAFLAASPDHADAHYYLGMLHHQLGGHVASLTHLTKSVALAPGYADRLSNLGVVALAAGDTDAAIAAFKQVVMLTQDRVDVWATLGDLLRDKGESAEALRCYESAVRLQPGFAQAQLNLGLLKLAAGDVPGAVAAAEASVRQRPDWPEAHNNLGNALKAAGNLQQALQHYKLALTLRPDFPVAENNIGIALMAGGRRDEAIATFESLLVRHPGHAEARVNLADALRESGRVAEAERQYHEALHSDPADLVALWNLGNLCWQQGRHAEAAGWYSTALKLKPDHAVLRSNLLYTRLYDLSISPESLLHMHREYSQCIEGPLKPAWRPPANVRDPDRRLKLGYVTADFRNHPVAHFMRPIMAHHDSASFDVFVYFNQSVEDLLTLEFKHFAHHWLPCHPMSDDALADQIRADGIDVLVDLGGHTEGNRLPVFARKPAPVQITYLNYPGTTGLDAMDWRITDHLADPEEHRSHYAERLLHLPNSLWCYEPPAYMPEVSPPPCLRSGRITFGSFNNVNKLTPACIHLWSALLRVLPDADLLIATADAESVRSSLAAQFAAQGISPARLRWKGKALGAEFVRWFKEVDIALDSFPMNGGTTTMESLWMGVPVISRVTQRFFGRAGLSILSAAGHPEWACQSDMQFLDIATTLARSPQQLANIRTSLRGRVAASPLGNAATFTRDLESLYRDAWREWCARH